MNSYVWTCRKCNTPIPIEAKNGETITFAVDLQMNTANPTIVGYRWEK